MFTHAIHTSIEIAAGRASVWKILADSAGYSDWNPFVVFVEGTFAVGNRLKVHLAPSTGKVMVFRPLVTEMTHGESFRWVGRLLVPLLFDGEHIFEIEETENGHARLIQREHFRGLLVPVLRRMLDTRTKADFERMNMALKARAESA